MKTVLLSIKGKQSYLDQEPEIIELMTEGTMEYCAGGWDIRYEETDLTGLQGTTTIFRVEPECITLTRQGPLNSQMIFREGVFHESLYQMEFGALMITVCATKLVHDITENGGTVDLTYGIDIEQSAGGMVEYHLDIRAK